MKISFVEFFSSICTNGHWWEKHHNKNDQSTAIMPSMGIDWLAFLRHQRFDSLCLWCHILGNRIKTKDSGGKTYQQIDFLFTNDLLHSSHFSGGISSNGFSVVVMPSIPDIHWKNGLRSIPLSDSLLFRELSRNVWTSLLSDGNALGMRTLVFNWKSFLTLHECCVSIFYGSNIWNWEFVELSNRKGVKCGCRSILYLAWIRLVRKYEIKIVESWWFEWIKWVRAEMNVTKNNKRSRSRKRQRLNYSLRLRNRKSISFASALIFNFH